MKKIKFIDLFAGIGGFHLAFHSLGCECVFASEFNPYARKTYEHNFKKISPNLFKNNMFNCDIRNISPSEIPDFDILCAGFPCQPFSQAGYKRGFDDNHKSERGNLFFNIADILEEKKPRAFFLENVRGLINHDNGNTFKIIRDVLEIELGYSFYFKVVRASDYGLPQLRPRVFMIGFRDEKGLKGFDFPQKIPLKFNMSDVWGGDCSREIGFTLRVGGRGSNINDRRNWDAYLVDGEVKKLMPKQGKMMQGFPDSFEFPVPATQAIKQLGNSVAVNAIKTCAKEILEHLKLIKTKEDHNMKKTRNKGEWSELYSFLKLINDKKVFLSDKKLHPKDSSFTVTKVTTLNISKSCILSESDIVLVEDKNSNEVYKVEVGSFLNSSVLKKLAEQIKNGSGTFQINEIDVIQNKLGLSIIRGGNSNQKADIVLDIENSEIDKKNEGFGIKSYLGSKPTLLNASGSNTNFVFKLNGIKEKHLDEINSIKTRTKLKDRLAKIIALGGEFEFIKLETETMAYNLKLIDTFMPKILSEMLLEFFINRTSSISKNIASVIETNRLVEPIENDLNYLEVKIKRFLVAILLGLFSGKKWDGKYTSNGTIVVKENGDQVCFHIIDLSALEDYLFENIKFDTPSTTRHRFGKIFKEIDGSLYFKLNLQLRF